MIHAKERVAQGAARRPGFPIIPPGKWASPERHALAILTTAAKEATQLTDPGADQISRM